MTFDAPEIEYAEQGQGPAILYIPGSFGTGAGWRQVIAGVGEGFRHVTTSLLGYGATAERRSIEDPQIAVQVDAIARTVAKIDQPVHLVAHSYGGLCALAFALGHKSLIKSMVLVEANPLDVLRQTGDSELYEQFRTTWMAFFRDFDNGVRDCARRVIDFYGGKGAFDAFPEKVRSYVIDRTPTNVLDWRAGVPFAPPLSALEALDIPTTVVRGGNGHPAMLRIAEILSDRLPKASMVTIAGGSHFLPASHPNEIARLVVQQVASSQQTSR